MKRYDTVNRAQRNADAYQPSTQSEMTESESTNQTKIRLNATWLTAQWTVFGCLWKTDIHHCPIITVVLHIPIIFLISGLLENNNKTPDSVKSDLQVVLSLYTSAAGSHAPLGCLQLFFVLFCLSLYILNIS